MPQRKQRSLDSRVSLISEKMRREHEGLKARLSGGVKPPVRTEAEYYEPLSKRIYLMIHAHAVDHSAREVGLTPGQARVFRRHIESHATDVVARDFNPFTTNRWSYVRLKATGKGEQFDPPISPAEEKRFVEAYNRHIEEISRRVLGGMGRYVEA